MKAVVQRVSKASVSVDGKQVSSINHGLLVLLGVYQTDGLTQVHVLAKKLLSLRVFADDHRDINRSIVDVQGEILLVSQFTLCARTDKGNRPSFVDAAHPDKARELYQAMISQLKEAVPVKTGQFGEYMQVQLTNDGPVTITLEA